MKIGCLFTVATLLISHNLFANVVDVGFLINQNTKDSLNFLKNFPELTIDHVKADQFEVYGPKGLEQFLQKNKIAYTNLASIEKSIAADYPKFTEIEKELKSLAKNYPSILKLYSIGKSTEGRELYVMKISKNVNVDDNRPEFKYIANMHGDEIVGREMMMRLIAHLAESYGRDQQITNLVNNYQIHIMPSMNPDGAEKRRRGNAKGIDLNRDFPDFTTNDNQNTLGNRQVETKAVMNWQKKHKFILSANFHGGAEVVNYPWDTSADKSPQEELVKSLSLNYAHDASYIGTSTVFENGITNGYAWYEVDGGMQDWSIYYHGDTQLTVELSDTKWPNYSMIDYYFEQNKVALVNYIAAIEQINLSKTLR